MSSHSGLPRLGFSVLKRPRPARLGFEVPSRHAVSDLGAWGFERREAAPRGLGVPSGGFTSVECVDLHVCRRRDVIDPEGSKECREGRSDLVHLARGQHIQQVKPRDDRGPVAHDS